jgi:hypothetical protein
MLNAYEAYHRLASIPRAHRRLLDRMEPSVHSTFLKVVSSMGEFCWYVYIAITEESSTFNRYLSLP